MKIRIENFTSLFLLVVILLAGCSGCAQKNAKLPQDETPIPEVEVEQPQTPDGVQMPVKVRQVKRPTIAELYAPDANEPKTPDDYYGDPLYYVRGVEYTHIGSTAGIDDSAIIIPSEKAFEPIESFIAGLSLLEKAKYFAKLEAADSYHDEAFTYAQRAIEVDPDNFEAHLIQAELLERLGTDAEVEAAYRKLLKWKPDSLRVLFNLSFYVADVDEKIDLLEKVAELAPTYRRGRALFLLGDLYRAQGQYDQAITLLKKAQVVNPAAAFLGLGRVYRKQGNYEKAIDALKQSYAIDPLSNPLGTTLREISAIESIMDK
ncbi:MAG: tetratricopeptide repeat protein [Candidatus Poribacteria bacterium]|nr:tetratricopeptide repeat protein [Candidatus Poribacteria bacterium]